MADRDAKWASKKRVIGGAANFLPTGSDAPSEWRDTMFAADAGFRDLGAFDLRPTPKSPLVGKATDVGTLLTTFPIERVLAAPLFEPARQPAGVERTSRAAPHGHGAVGALEPAHEGGG